MAMIWGPVNKSPIEDRRTSLRTRFLSGLKASDSGGNSLRTRATRWTKISAGWVVYLGDAEIFAAV